MSSSRAVAWVAALCALVASSLAAFTRPFTWQADVVTAVALAALVAVVVVQLVGPVPAAFARRGPASAPVRRAGHRFGAHRYGPGRWAPWLVVLALVAGWELYCYFASPRVAHPTLSSLLDMATASDLGRGVAFAVWLALGAYLVTR